MAIASSAIEMRSPDGEQHVELAAWRHGLTWCARSSSSSVVSPIADTTTTTSSPALRFVTMRSATRLIRSASATDEPPYFCTINATADLLPLPRSPLPRSLLPWRAGRAWHGAAGTGKPTAPTS